MLCRVVTESSQKLRVRESPNENAKIVGHLMRDNVYDVEPISAGWYKVISADTGVSGFSSARYLQTVESAATDAGKIAVYFSRDELTQIKAYVEHLMEG